MLKNATIKKRLTLLITMVSSAAVTVTTIVITLIGIYNMRENLYSQLDDTAVNVGKSNLAYISFDQKEAATRNLQDVFGTKPSILRVCMYDASNVPAAFYYGTGAPDRTCPNISNMHEGVGTYDDNTIVMRHLDNNGMLVASITLESDMREIKAYLFKQFITAVLVILAVNACAYVFALAMQGTISIPVRALSDVARRVTVEEDYSLRVQNEQASDGAGENEIYALI